MFSVSVFSYLKRIIQIDTYQVFIKRTNITKGILLLLDTIVTRKYFITKRFARLLEICIFNIKDIIV